jgi:hypothetical protein
MLWPGTLEDFFVPFDLVLEGGNLQDASDYEGRLLSMDEVKENPE